MLMAEVEAGYAKKKILGTRQIRYSIPCLNRPIKLS